MTPLADHDPATLILSAGRAHAVERFPYLAVALFSMMPVRDPGSGTFGVDKRWRVYWDPEFVLNPSKEAGGPAMTFSECAAVWVHEVGHLLRQHNQRFTATLDAHDYHPLFNKAGDGCINDDLKASGLTLPIPEIRIYSDTYKGWAPGMTTEAMYQILKDQFAKENRCPSCGEKFSDDKPDKGTKPGEKDDSQDEKDEKGEKGDSQGAGQQAGEDGAQSQPGDSPGEGAGGSQPGDSSSQGAGSGSGEGSGTGEGSSEGPGAGSGSSTGSGPGTSPGHRGHAHDGPCPGTGQQPGDCGSGAGGPHRDWELPDLGNDDDGSVDEGRGRMIREQTARAIVAHARARGNVPAGFLRAADEILNPTIDWRKQLTTVVRRSIASQAGRRDYSYSRPSRRSSGIGGGVVLPSMRQPPPPNVAIVIDTSGSVSDRMLGQALSEVKDIIERAVGHSKPVRIINCDAKSTLPTSVRNIRNFQLVGGGGTDMRVGMKDAANDRPRPDLVLVFTDGFTPWPAEPPEGAPTAKYAAVLLDDAGVRDVPDWMAKIVIEDQN